MKSLNFTVLKLAFPLIISNLTVPLLGVTNTFIAGHLHRADYIGAIGLIGIVFDCVYWALGFLRMGTTAVISQAFGQNKPVYIIKIIVHSVVIALGFSALLILFHSPMGHTIFAWVGGSPSVNHYAEQLYAIRIYGAPATLINFILIGAFIGWQDNMTAMLMMLTVNGVAIILGLFLTGYLDLSINGIAWADVLAQYTGLALGLYNLFKKQSIYIEQYVSNFSLNGSLFRMLFEMNNDIFIRTLLLMLVLAFFTIRSDHLGALVIAANTLLMNFLLIMAYAQDGFNNVAESLVGKNIGLDCYEGAKQAAMDVLAWSCLISMFFVVIYALLGRPLVNFMTDITAVRLYTYHFLGFIIFMPIVSVWCFVLDGIFIGANQFKAMRNTMILSFLFYGWVWFGMRAWGNLGLWLSLTSFYIFRALFMGMVLWIFDKKGTFFSLKQASGGI